MLLLLRRLTAELTIFYLLFTCDILGYLDDFTTSAPLHQGAAMHATTYNNSTHIHPAT